VNFLVDAQLPPALALWLVQQGHTAAHVEDLGLRKAEDTEIWQYALRTGALIITKDEDFAERTARTTTGPIIVWLRIGNATNRALMH
jgi:predicted nuclease of predicted toxin-antitoxin system